ncbi:MAG: hypothetical protein RR598_06355 [Anaerorhabdus sp.]|uniref:hypothetical protein n=1 Tax=Anaerorhabdus sp. TaxID=1872524 RepID=UPI002FC77186
MSLTNKVRKIVATELNKIDDYTISSNVSTTEQSNHITYYLNEIGIYRNRTDYSLTISIFGNSIEDIEDKSDMIKKLFDFNQINSDTVGTTFYFENKNNIDDAKERLYGRLLRFQVIAYERSLK